MSVVAGCSLLDGILLGADCRITFKEGARETHRDTVQKLIILNSQSAIGFVGDLNVARNLLVKMVQQGERRTRVDPVSLGGWLPRLFRRLYANLHTTRRVSFVVGSVIPGRPNFVERESVLNILRRNAFGNPRARRSTMPAIFYGALQTQAKYVAIEGSPTGLLYVMDSPHFLPRFYKPLEYAAVGSGEGVIVNIARAHDMIIAGPALEHGEAMWLTMAMQDFMTEKNLSTVGGMFTLIKLTSQGLIPLEWRTGQVPDGTLYELAFDDGRWIQRNITTGKEIKLSLPWEVDLNDREEHTFDELRYRTF